MIKTPIYEILLTSIIIAYVILSTLDITAPWNSTHSGFIGAQYSNLAINYLKFGYFETKLGQLSNTASNLQTGNEKYEYYVNRPIGTAMLISFSFLVFGIHEWSARVVAVLFNILAIIFLFYFVKTYWDKEVAILSCFFTVFSPMFFYIRNFISPETITIFFTTFILYAYAKWLVTNKKRYFYLIFFAFITSTFFNWENYFLVPPILIHYFIFVKKREKDKKLFYLIPTAIFCFLFYLGHIWLLMGMRGLENLFKVFIFRLNLDESWYISEITPLSLVKVLITNLQKFYTNLYSYAFLLFPIITLVKLKSNEKNILPLLIFLSFSLYLFIFSNLFWIHDFLVLFFAPIFGIFIALILSEIKYITVRKNCTISKINFYGFLFIISFLFIILSYPVYKSIYISNSEIWPIIKFLSKNDGNIIVSFDEHPQNFQLKFYLSKRVVLDIRDKDKLIKNLDKGFKYFLVKDDNPIDEELKNYLENNFKSKKIHGYVIYELK